MDDDERETTRIDTEHVVPAQPATPVTPVTAATPVVPVAPAVPVPAAVPVALAPASRVVTSHTYTTTRPTAAEMARRVVVLLFGILQAMLVLRIILLLLGANRGNDIVQFILNVTSAFVEPFRDMFSMDRITSGSTGSILDIAAIVALIAWTLIELLILAVVNLFSMRRTTAEY